jgi:endonuclease/exonuclease/phosphatase family metal-dependent hydrolase
MRFLLKSSILLALLSLSSAHALILGSFNVRYDNPDDAKRGNGWPQRAPVIAGMIRFHNFDVLGTQEAYRNQLDDLQKLLPGYDHVGVGRDDGRTKGEHAAIFFKKDKFRLLESGTFWLSETPDEPGVRGWDADRPPAAAQDRGNGGLGEDRADGGFQRQPAQRKLPDPP